MAWAMLLHLRNKDAPQNRLCMSKKHSMSSERATPDINLPMEQIVKEPHAQAPCNGKGASPAVRPPVHATRCQAESQVAYLERQV